MTDSVCALESYIISGRKVASLKKYISMYEFVFSQNKLCESR